MDDPPPTGGPPGGRPELGSPLDALEVLAVQEVEVHAGLRHLELFTPTGLLTILWHGDPGAELVVLALGGAMGGLLGPADGLYQDLGEALAGDEISLARVAYRRPGTLGRCVHDALAVAELAGRRGAERVVAMGHSFGGAVAVQVGASLTDQMAGVVTLATQSAGCEPADRLAGVPLLLVHGDADELLPVEASHMVRLLAGHGEIVIEPGAGHLLTEAGGSLRRRLVPWLQDRVAGVDPEDPPRR